MITRPLGTTGLTVSLLGFGAGQIGDDRLTDADASRLLNTALDLGITLIDTARSYGRSEERIGTSLRRRRQEFVLSTKVGYGVPDVPDWTFECVRRGIDDALRRLQTDVIDVAHLHSCPADVLLQNGVLDALEEAKRAGKVRAVAYSGENDDLSAAILSARVDVVQLSVNVCDQRGARIMVPAAAAAGIGVIGKRPTANAPWRFSGRPEREDEAVYWERWHALGIEGGMDPQELALRFSVFVPGVASCITGTAREEHLRRNCAMVERGDLPNELRRRITAAFSAAGAQWPGVI